MKRFRTVACLSIAIGFSTLAAAQTTTTLNPTADAYIESGKPSVNFGAASILLVRQTGTATNLSRASYLNFSLTGLPAGAITSAKLRLYGRHEMAGSGVPVGVRGATNTSAWGEAALTWANAYQLAPVNYGSAAIATTTISGAAAQYYEWDVTAFIASRQAAGFATLSAYTNVLNQYRVSFNSKEGVNKPQLVVVTGTANALRGECPANYQVKVGLNTDFPTPTGNRAFSLNLPADMSTPRPVWVPLTGTAESTNENLDSRGGNRKLTESGFVVIAPLRKCANQDPDGAGIASERYGECNRSGSGGWNFNTWNNARSFFSAAGDQWKNAEGPDSAFFEAAVRCVATQYKLDSRRLYIGGISEGGTMTNRALTFRSDFWAGGMPLSGEWFITREDGTAYGSDQGGVNGERTAALVQNPTAIFQSRVGPFPLKSSLEPMIVLTVWGGANDLVPADGAFMDLRSTTQASSNYFSSMPNVVHVACTGSHGHIWPTTNRDAFNLWALTTLSSHPKGTSKWAFVLTPPPSGYSCRVGAYRDHYSGT